jgi:phosphate-selective porin OprO/OprP
LIVVALTVAFASVGRSDDFSAKVVRDPSLPAERFASSSDAQESVPEEPLLERPLSVGFFTGASGSDEGIVALNDDGPDLLHEDVGASDALLKEVQTLRKRLEKLEATDKKRTDAEAKKKSDDAKKKDAEARKAEDWIDLSSEKWTVRLGGIVQMDYINWANADPAIRGPAANPGTKDYFEFRRLRLSAEGTGYGVYDFRLQLTLEPETVGENPAGTVVSPDIKDAYFSMNEIPWLGRFRIGNFFVPFGLEQVTNDSYGVFMERSIPTQGIFTGDREVGAALYNCTEDKRVTWTVGMFFDSISEALKERIDDNQGYRMSGRLTWLPYYDEPSNGRYMVHTGVGVLHTQDQDNRVRFRTRPEVHEGPRLIDSGVISATKYTAANVEGAVVMGPFAVQSEGYICQVQRFAADPVMLHGAYAHMTYFLTGENRKFEPFGIHGAQFGRNVPHSNFFLTPGGHGSGAWEAKARWSYLNLDAINSGRINDMTCGFNWYWTDRTRVMFDWVHPMTSNNTTFGTTNSDLLMTRFDFNW